MKKKLSQMSREEKVGQLILGQVKGWRLEVEFKTFLKKYKLGAYRVTYRNLKPNTSPEEKKKKLKKFLAAVKRSYQEKQSTASLIEQLLYCKILQINSP